MAPPLTPEEIAAQQAAIAAAAQQATLTDAAASTASILAFRAPQFCTHDPNMWFNLVECNFKANKITSSITKFSHATSLLPQDVLTKVSDVIRKAIQSDTPYEDLKAAILKRLESSVAARLQELLSKEELGNEKPSDLLRRMQRLLQDKLDTFDPVLFAQLFYQRLPADIQRALFCVKDKLSLEDFAKLADDYMSTVQTQKPLVAHVTAPAAAAAPASTSDMLRLTELVSQLTLQVNSLTNRMEKQERKPRPRERSRSKSRQRTYELCWYHYTYGAKAKKCNEPCDYKPTSSSSENPEGGH